MKTKTYFPLTVVAVLFLISCHKDDDKPLPTVPANKNLEVTTVTTKIIDGLNVITLTSKDLDGDGPNAPVVTVSGALNADTDYTGTVTLLNEKEDPVKDVTLDIQEKNTLYQLFFQAPTDIGAFSYADMDTNGKPIGLQFTLHTGMTPSTGNLIVTLQYNPDKGGVGVTDGDMSNAGGSTVIEAVYPIQVIE